MSFRRRGRVVLGWIVLLVVVIAVGPRLAGDFEANYATPGSESEAAADLVTERFPGATGDTIDVVWRAPQGVRDRSVQATMDRFLAEAERLEGMGQAEAPRVSRDGTIAVTRVGLDRRAWDVPTSTAERLIERSEAISRRGLQVELGGGPIRDAEGGASPEIAGLIGAVIVLLIAFGSVVAAGVPLLTALVSLGLSGALIGVLTAVLDVPEWAPAVAGLIGIGVGVDYALLILTRFRAALASGHEPRQAVIEAEVTAGRSVLVAGTTVVISLLGLFLMGLSYANGVAVSASLAVLVVMAASVTLVPALLGFAGRRVDRLRIPGLGRSARPGKETPAARWSHIVQRRPWTAAIAGALALIALATPALGLRLGFPDAGNDATGKTTREAYDLVRRGFGTGANGPFLLVADLPRPADAQALDGVVERLRSQPAVAFVSEPRLNAGRDAAILSVVPRTAPQAAATADLVDRLRDELLPRALRGSDIGIDVGGISASFVDQSEGVAARLPLFIAGVLALSFLILLAAFRSPLIALKAGVMNLLSIGAAYGVMALVAEGGFAGQLVGIDTDTPVPPFIPVMMFAILFGLSMDYEVFLLSRVREEYLRSGETHRAVADGLAKTARVITAAAAIMVVVFLAFVFSTEIFLKLLGVGMATAVFVDATIVRMLLVPAVMQLLGSANWWVPAWLDRALPRFDVEPPTVPPS